MKKTFLMLFAFILSCGFSSCNDDKYPQEIPTTDYSLIGTSCQWANLEANKVIVINSQEELLAHISCGGDDIPKIDFKNNSLIRTFGTTTYGIHNITKSLQQISDAKYQLNVDITLDLTAVAEGWEISFTTNKLLQNAIIELRENQHH